MKDPYLYPNSETLKNLFNKTDETKFSAIEEALSGLSIEYADVFDIVGQGESVLSKMNSTVWDGLSSYIHIPIFPYNLPV